MPASRELDHEYRMRKLQVFQTLTNAFLRVVCVVVPFGLLYLSIRELAGRQTFADVTFKVLADLKANRSFAQIAPWGTTTAAAGWALGERFLRKKNIKRTSDEINELQLRIDPRKRSSRLTNTGSTNQEDL